MFPKKAEQRIRVTLELFKAHAQDQYLVSEVLLIPISLFRALADVGIDIGMITTSEIRITCIVDESRLGDAARALHAAFELDRPEPA